MWAEMPDPSLLYLAKTKSPNQPQRQPTSSISMRSAREGFIWYVFAREEKCSMTLWIRLSINTFLFMHIWFGGRLCKADRGHSGHWLHTQMQRQTLLKLVGPFFTACLLTPKAKEDILDPSAMPSPKLITKAVRFWTHILTPILPPDFLKISRREVSYGTFND